MKVAVFTAKGLGDGLIMMLVANALKKEGFSVTVFNEHLPSFFSYFEGFSFKKVPEKPPFSDWIKEFDLFFIQYDHSPFSKELLDLRKTNQRVISFYSNFAKLQKSYVHPDDYILNRDIPILHSLQKKMSSFLQKKVAKNIDIKNPLSLKKDPKKVLLHPFSTNPQKNWTLSKYFSLGDKLKKIGYEPIFILSPSERPFFLKKAPKGAFSPLLPHLSDLAALMQSSSYFIGNESGPAHLASLLGLSCCILSGSKITQHWQPGWKPAKIIQPSKWIPNWKSPFRLRENYWQKWISVKRVLQEFQKNIDKEAKKPLN